MDSHSVAVYLTTTGLGGPDMMTPVVPGDLPLLAKSSVNRHNTRIASAPYSVHCWLDGVRYAGWALRLKMPLPPAPLYLFLQMLRTNLHCAERIGRRIE